MESVLVKEAELSQARQTLSFWGVCVWGGGSGGGDGLFGVGVQHWSTGLSEKSLLA